jgi:3-oxoacyl-[acyl-carrier-protein] synthase-3
MSANPVYITIALQHILPQSIPYANDEMEEYLGYINGKPSKSKKIVLRNNAITNRYYALAKGGKSNPYQCPNDGFGSARII